MRKLRLSAEQSTKPHFQIMSVCCSWILWTHRIWAITPAWLLMLLVLTSVVQCWLYKVSVKQATLSGKFLFGTPTWLIYIQKCSSILIWNYDDIWSLLDLFIVLHVCIEPPSFVKEPEPLEVLPGKNVTFTSVIRGTLHSRLAGSEVPENWWKETGVTSTLKTLWQNWNYLMLTYLRVGSIPVWCLTMLAKHPALLVSL